MTTILDVLEYSYNLENEVAGLVPRFYSESTKK